MPVTVVQSKSGSVINGTVISLPFDAPVAAGNAIILLVGREGSSNRAYTIADTNGGTPDTFNQLLNLLGANLREAEIDYAMNVAGGSTTVTATSSGTDTFSATAIEVSGLDNAAPTDVNGSSDEGATNTSHVCASPGINTAANVIVVAIGQASATWSTITYPSGYTSITGVRGSTMFAYRTSASALSGEQASWSSSSARQGLNVLASFKGAAAATAYPWQHYQQMMAG